MCLLVNIEGLIAHAVFTGMVCYISRRIFLCMSVSLMKYLHNLLAVRDNIMFLRIGGYGLIHMLSNVNLHAFFSTKESYIFI